MRNFYVTIVFAVMCTTLHAQTKEKVIYEYR
jgi:hypothetical protein